MSHPASRVLSMLELLQANHRLTGPELAQRLAVDVRTVRRYANLLVELGIPVDAERGRYGGYRLLPGYKLPPLMLSNEEAVAVVLGLVAGERLGLSTAAPAVASALAKIQRVLPATLREQTLAVQATLGFTLTQRQASAPAAGTLLTLGEATSRRQRVRLTYQSWKGEDSEREFDSYGLVFHSGRWYVAGHDHRSGELRTFRLDRMRSVDLVTATFSPPPDFDAVAHVTQSLAGVPYTWEVEVLIDAPLAQVRKRIPASTATLEEVDGGVLLSTRAQRLPGMAQMLAGLDWPFTVRKPDQLRAELLELAARLTIMADRRSD